MNNFDKEIKDKLNGELINTDNAYESIIDDPKMIGTIKQTPDLCMLALIKDYTCFSLIKNPTIAMKLFVKDRLDVIDELGGNIILDF